MTPDVLAFALVSGAVLSTLWAGMAVAVHVAR